MSLALQRCAPLSVLHPSSTTGPGCKNLDGVSPPSYEGMAKADRKATAGADLDLDLDYLKKRI